MAKALHVDREQVRLLAIAIGNKAAAEQCGIPYPAVRKWSSRYKWHSKPKLPQQPQHVTVATRPVDVLGKYSDETKLSLAKSCQRMAKDSELANLRHAGKVKEVAQTAAIVHGWDKDNNKGNTILNLGVLIGNTPVRDSDSDSNKARLLQDQSDNHVIDID